jgi:hypothetical protein
VLLCLANPASNGGPKGVAECVPTINKLYHDLAKGRSMPTCDLADGNDGSSYARRVWEFYDPCPASLKPAPRGPYVVEGRKKADGKNVNVSWWAGSRLFDLSGKVGISEASQEMGMSKGPQACVGESVGSYRVSTGGGDAGGEIYTVQVFDKLVWQQAQPPRAIDVYIDGKLYQRVRF